MSLPAFVKTYKNIILITIFIVVGIVAYCYIRNLVEENQQLKEQANVLKLQKQGTTVKVETRYKDTSGDNHIVIDQKANTISDQALKEGSAVRIGLLDTVSTALKVAKDQIDMITKVNYTLSKTNFLLQRRIDSVTKKPVYNFSDNHLNYTEVGDSTRVGSYTYNGDLITTDYSKKKIPIIGRTFNYTDIYSTDSSFKINSVNRLTIEHATKPWSVKLRAGALYNIDNFHQLIGGKIELGYKNFNLTGSRYYNLLNGTKLDLVGFDYTLVSF